MAQEAIFIGYRRDDSAREAGHIYDAFASRVGPSHVFKDVDNIPLGEDFSEHLRGILPRCRVALIVIGPHWVEARDEEGHRRLHDPFDWVRIEVELALAAGDLRVVPVLVNGARMPRAEEVPPSLYPLLRRNAAIIRPGTECDEDIDRLFRSLGLVIAPEMVRIPAGEFMMGAPSSETSQTSRWRTPSGGRIYWDKGDILYESPLHRVRIKAFELGKYPVTFAEWDAANAAGANLHRPEDEGWGRDRRPVINVSWRDAQLYIGWLNSNTSGGYRLPSEAEWEYACRAGTTTAFSTGDSISERQARFYCSSTAPVGSYAPNAFGLHDMHGNVWELCEDVWHRDYNGAPSDGSAWTSGSDGWAVSRVCRGGMWKLAAPQLRSAHRYCADPAARDSLYGVRVARTIEIGST